MTDLLDNGPLVAYDDQSHAMFGHDVEEHFPDCCLRHSVEHRGHLISDEKTRVGVDYSCQAEALKLASR